MHKQKRNPSLAALTLGLLALGLSACLSLGQKTLPEASDTPQYLLTACDSKTSALAIQGKQLPLQVLSTAKTPWNTHLRYVYPYTRNTVQFEVSITQSSEASKEIVTLAEETLLYINENAAPTPSLSFAYWEKAWPTSAARNGQELHDRSMAMGEVIKQRWQARTLYPGETYTALAVFPLNVLSQAPQQLVVSYQTGSAKAEILTLCFSPKPSPRSAS